MATNNNYSFAGHETFAFRFAWLPKAVEAVLNAPCVLSDENQAMVDLGVGKNMVRSIRFWAMATGVIKQGEMKGFVLTEFGKHIFLPENGLDPFLEDDQTLWLLHWQLARSQRPLFAWDFLLNAWHEPDLVPSSIIAAARRILSKSDVRVSDSSLRGHLAVFFHTYYPTKSKKGDVLEAGLDCPLVQINLLEYRGKRESLQGKPESIHAFRRGRKPEINDAFFCYALCDYWSMAAPYEETLSFREVATRPSSPGQVLKIEDQEIRERLERIADSSGEVFSYLDSSLTQSIHRSCDLSEELIHTMRKGIYS